MATDDSWELRASEGAMASTNMIFGITDSLRVTSDPNKPLIKLSVGDPCTFGNLPTHQSIVETIAREVVKQEYNGYPPAVGYADARQAVADTFSGGNVKYGVDDIILTCGCSGAIEMTFVALASHGDNILAPKPCFDKYEAMAEQRGINLRYFSLLPEKGWYCDLDEMERLIDDKTKAIIITNPSNPTGAVYNRKHLCDIVAIAERHRVPILSDEIYSLMVFSGAEYIPMASLTNSVPVITVHGLSKNFCVPGWRCGWLMIHDPKNRLHHVRKGYAKLAGLLLGANSVIQAALPSILKDTPKSFFEEFRRTLEDHATYFVDRFQKMPGLKVIIPQGALYIMVQILSDEYKDIDGDMEFVQKLVDEEKVFVLPGKAVKAPGFFRVVICPPKDILETACDRMTEFCKRHHISAPSL